MFREDELATASSNYRYSLSSLRLGLHPIKYAFVKYNCKICLCLERQSIIDLFLRHDSKF